MVIVTNFRARKYQQYLSNGSRIIDASTASEKKPALIILGTSK
jgi:hypothetical protein